jgi:hypothetical protein
VAAVTGAPSSIAASDILQSGDSLAALRCRQAKASGPPGVTPRQLTMKSRWQVNRIALCCWGVGATAGAGAAAGCGGAAAGAERGCGAGRAVRGGAGSGRAAVAAGCFAGAVAAGAGGRDAGAVAGGVVVVAAGAGRAGAAAGGGAGAVVVCVGAAGLGVSALTALRQAGESPATLRCRHCRASAPPRGTPEHFDMKSDRQFDRIAFCWS